MNGSASLSAPALQFWLTDGSRLDLGVPFGSYRPVVVFDSGVGGLTVAKHIRQLLPDLDLLYVADNQWFPYGVRPGDAVASRVTLLFRSLRRVVDPLAVVIACNTASAAIKEVSGNVENGDYICISPPVVEAANISQTKKIVVLATAATINNPTIRDAITAASQQATVWPIAAQLMVDLAERKLAGEKVDMEVLADLINRHLSVSERESVDTVVLGCTHFPHLLDELQQVFPVTLNWVDPAYLVALKLRARVEREPLHGGTGVRLTALTSLDGAVKYDQVFSSRGFSNLKKIVATDDLL